MRPGRVWLPAAGIAIAAMLGAPAPAEEAAAGAKRSACVACHEQLDDELGEPLRAWEHDVHRTIGLGCEGCHGGDPSPALAGDPEASMAASKGFRGAPDRLRTATFCGECHADAEFIKRYDPGERVDQLAEYRTSVHGKRNAAGDPVPATCTDCHGVHGIREVSSPEAPVHATNVPETCARCHADPSIMGPYGIPTTQYGDYLGGVHAAALLDRGDTAAPACNDCHGNHGATPPGSSSVANVCGQCHGREAQLFAGSIKKELFDAMEVSECTTCHAQHRTLHPTAELFHGTSAPSVTAGRVTGLAPFEAELGDVASGEAVEATWVVAMDPHVKTAAAWAHEVAVKAEGIPALMIDAAVAPGADSAAPRRTDAGGLSAELSVEFPYGTPVHAGDSLRYRLRVTAAAEPLRALEVLDRPGSGLAPVRESVCLQCHSPGDDCDKATERMYEAVSTATRELREAENLLRRAESKGMDVGEDLFKLDGEGLTAVVESRSLIHSFDPDRLVEQADKGREVAKVSLAAGQAAMGELQYRRKGLAVSLVLVSLVLVALYLKIRQVG